MHRKKNDLWLWIEGKENASGITSLKAPFLKVSKEFMDQLGVSFGDGKMYKVPKGEQVSEKLTLKSVNNKIVNLDKKINDRVTRLEIKVDKGFINLEKRINDKITNLDKRINDRVTKLEVKVDKGFARLENGIRELKDLIINQNK